MKRLAAILSSILLLAVAAFCSVGFLATFEPTDNPAQFRAFRIGYAVIGAGCLVAAGCLIVEAFRSHDQR